MHPSHTADTLIRLEKKSDCAAIHELNSLAFPSQAEANLVDRLRKEACPFLSLVADQKNSLVGHLVFSPLTLENNSECKVLGLAPMCVEPSLQKQGIGCLLVEQGLQLCKARGFHAVAVLGHPHYYPRFGFHPASHYRLRSEYPVPDNVFMALELQENSLQHSAGLVRYHTAFEDL